MAGKMRLAGALGLLTVLVVLAPAEPLVGNVTLGLIGLRGGLTVLKLLNPLGSKSRGLVGVLFLRGSRLRR